MRSRAYAAVVVNRVELAQVLAERAGQDVVVGIDVGKRWLLVVLRWSNGAVARPWRVANPCELPVLVGLLQQLAAGRSLRVALESSGTYGDALRQALGDAGLAVVRVSSKASHDYAEIYDGVPSQHDGKDAAVVAELAAQGKARPWPYQLAEPWAQELTYWVDRLEAQRRIAQLWQGRLEALLARHWPEAIQVLKGSTGTLLRALVHYGSPAALAADAQAAVRLRRWSGPLLAEEKITRLVETARCSVGVRLQAWPERQLREYATAARQTRQEAACCRRQLRRLAEQQPVLQAQGRAVGVPTACVLWVQLGNPQAYTCGAAYRKAMGLNLKERSSGEYQGQLRLSKRGSGRVRHWLYFAALRQVQKAGLQKWYAAKKAQDPRPAKRLLVAVMRKLALALYHVGARGATFDSRRLFARLRRRQRR
jgi:transposase